MQIGDAMRSWIPAWPARLLRAVLSIAIAFLAAATSSFVILKLFVAITMKANHYTDETQVLSDPDLAVDCMFLFFMTFGTTFLVLAYAAWKGLAKIMRGKA